jgi:hypothetical protein
MFTWHKDLLESVKTPKFFLTYKSTDWHELAVLENHFGALPSDYKQFLAECGAGKFVRQWSRDLYGFRIFSNPQRAAFDPAEVCLVAETEAGSLFGYRLKESHRLIEFCGPKETPLDLPVGEVFRCQIDHLVNGYGKRRLAEIVRGPEPFTERELELVRALGEFEINVQVSGEQFEFNIQNNSSLELDFITLGAIIVRQRPGLDGNARPYGGNGRIWLDVSGIKPGESAIRYQSCYHSLANPEDIQIYRLFPGPEDRRYFKEFPDYFQFGK